MKALTRYNIYLTLIYILLICISFTGCDPRYGFWSSKFRLADNSRLPKWFNVPPGYDRTDLKMTIDFYATPLPFFNNAVITIYGPPPENKVLMKKAGKSRDHPYTLKQIQEKRSRDVCQSYSIITVDGIEEVFEQDRKCQGEGNILYIIDADNPKLRESLKESK